MGLSKNTLKELKEIPKSISECNNKINEIINNIKNVKKITQDNGNAITLNENTNLNTVISTGIYSGSNLINTPDKDIKSWYVEVKHSNLDGFAHQTVTSLDDCNNIKQYHRQMSNNVWGNWRSL